MKRRTMRLGLTLAVVLATTTWTACASGGGRPGTFTRLQIDGDAIREVGYETAYEALVNHRELVMFAGELGFKGSNEEASGRDAESWFVPMLVVDGNFNQNDTITTLRRIDADQIETIRLFKSSMVPPRYRRPEARGGVIEVTTRGH